MAVNYFSKPVFLATLICIIFIYSNENLILEKEPVHSLVQANEISDIYGKIISSPIKTSNGNYYSCDFKPESVTSKKGIKSTVYSGKINIYIPSILVEQYFPGKLFTLSKNNISTVFEKGGIYSFTGKNTNKGFYVSSCNYSFWPENILGKISYIRALCRIHFKRLMFGWGEGGGLILALLSGSKEYTNLDTAKAFRNAGLSHILALSGMHLSMFSAIAIFIGKKIGKRKTSFLIRIISLILFVWFAGFSPSLLRAFICAMTIIVASLSGSKKPNMVMVLCFSFLLQIIIFPNHIYNIGFILSYGALWGILLANRYIYSILVKKLPTGLSGALGASISAQLFTAPISLSVFGTFCPIGILATVVISPMITIYIYSGLLLILLTLLFPFIQTASGIFINLQYNIIKNLVYFFSQAPIWSVN